MRGVGKIMAGGGFVIIDGKPYSCMYHNGKPVARGITEDELKSGVESVLGKGWTNDGQSLNNDEKDRKEDQCEQS